MKKLCLSLVLGIFFIFLCGIGQVSAATLYWVGNNGADASVASNWKTTNPAGCGSGDAGAAPTTTDTMNFDADCDNGAAIDVSFGGVVSGMLLSSGYAGTVTLQRSLQSSSTVTISGGVLNASNQTLDIDGSFAMNNASATIRASSGTMHFASTFNVTAGTWDGTTNAGGTVDFDGTGSLSSCTGITFNLVTFNNTGTRTVNNSNCSIPLGTNPTNSSASITVSGGTLSGGGTLTKTNATLTLQNGASLSGFTGLAVSTLTLSATTASNSINLSSYTVVDIDNAFNLNTPTNPFTNTFTAPSGTMTVAGNFSLNSGSTFNVNAGTVEFDGSTATLSCNSVVFNAVHLYGLAGGVKTVSSDCSLPLGSNPTVTNRVTLAGEISGLGKITFSSASGSSNINTGAALSDFSGIEFADGVTIGGANLDFSGYTSAIFMNLTLNSGSLALPNGADLNGTLAISGGTITAPSGTMTLAGNFTYSSGTFNHNNGTTVLDGGSQTIVGTTFYNLTKTVSSASTLTFPAGGTETILGNLTLGGFGSGKLSLRSSTSGTQWNIDARGGRALSNLNVQDSNNLNSNVMIASDSVDSGNNTGWDFTSDIISLALINPADGDVTHDDRPTFSWKARDQTGGTLTNYHLTIDNGESGSFEIGDIPANRTTDYLTDRYLVHYEGFEDSDPYNNVIFLTTKSSSSWEAYQNDGKLKEGNRTWTVTAYNSFDLSLSRSRKLTLELVNNSGVIVPVALPLPIPGKPSKLTYAGNPDQAVSSPSPAPPPSPTPIPQLTAVNFDIFRKLGLDTLLIILLFALIFIRFRKRKKD